VLIGSAVPKLLAPLQFQQLVALHCRWLPRPWVRPVSRSVPLLEVALAAFWLSGALTPLAAASSAVLFLTFAFVVFLEGRRTAEPCGCFGRLYTPSPRFLMTQDVLLAALTIVVAWIPVSHFGLLQFLRYSEIEHARLEAGLIAATALAAAAVGYAARWKPDDAPQTPAISKEGSRA
jgi:uncharacterized membrane protein YphA (DoxX/SURF4 family)